MTKPLSPTAQAVLDAYNEDRPVGDSLPRNALVEALRAAANQLDPQQHIKDISYVHQNYVDGWSDVLNLIIDIAEDLEAL